MYFCLHQTLPSFYTPKSRDQKKERGGEITVSLAFISFWDCFFFFAACVCPHHHKCVILKRLRSLVREQSCTSFGGNWLPCKLKDTRKPSFYSLEMYMCSCHEPHATFFVLLSQTPLFMQIYTTSLKFKTKLTSLYLFLFRLSTFMSFRLYVHWIKTLWMTLPSTFLS